MSGHPIPIDALDDRLGFTGTAGSGKTYNSGTGVERLLARKSRVVIPDPLGVWWGLALHADGKTPSTFRKRDELVIFGGRRGDLGLTEHSGALIGETVAGMKESCILDLSELGTKASERRFMLAFLTALHKHKTKEPLHVIFDEADMWAPQRLMDRDGDAARLLGMMETIVRRGRVKGFIPWLITQRPAVLSKDVLSQVDGLITFKLTSSQDRDAIGNWVEGQADKGQWKEIWGALPTLERGQGVVWLPARGVLRTAKFPTKVTFDSSATPKRGQKVKQGGKLKPVNIDKLKERLAVVDAEVKARDPNALRAENAKLKNEKAALEKQLSAKATSGKPVDRNALRDAEKRGFDQAKKKLAAASERAAQQSYIAAVKAFLEKQVRPLTAYAEQMLKDAKLSMPALERVEYTPPAPIDTKLMTAAMREIEHVTRHHVQPVKLGKPAAAATSGLAGPQVRLLNALAFWQSVGQSSPSRSQAAFVAGYSPKSSGFEKCLSNTKTAGLIDYPGQGRVGLTSEGAKIARPLSADEARHAIMSVLSRPQLTLTNVLITAGGPLTREDLANRSDYSAKSSGFEKVLSQLSSLTIATYPAQGQVAITDWAQDLFVGRIAA